MDNLTKRTVISILSIPIILGLAYLGNSYFLVLCFIIQMFCLFEFYNLFERNGFRPFKYLSILFSLMLFLVKYFNTPYLFFIPFLFLFLIITLEIFKGKDSNPINVFLSIGGILYISIPFILLSELSSDYRLVFILFILIWTSDTIAYFVGKYLGKTKLSKISPGKTVEGAVAGLLASVLCSLIFAKIYFELITIFDSLIIGLIVGLFGVVGDYLQKFILN